MDKIFISELLTREELKEVIKETGAGLEAIHFSISENLDHFDAASKIFEENLIYWDHPDLTFHGPFLDLIPVSFDSFIQEATLKRFNQGYEAARHFGAGKIVYHSGMIPSVYMTIGWAERMMDFLNRFLPGKTGPFIVMENHFDQVIELFEDVMRKLDPRLREHFGFCLDIGHANCFSKEPVMDWVKRLGPWIRHIHIHDNDGTRDQHLALGEGNMDIEDILKAILDYTEERTWTIECSSYDAVMKSFDVWQKVMENAKVR